MRPANYPQGELDALKWAEYFMELFDNRRDEIDESLMLTWFANAIMTGYDYAKNKADSELSAKLREAFEAGRVDKRGIIPSTTAANLTGFKYDNFYDWQRSKGE